MTHTGPLRRACLLHAGPGVGSAGGHHLIARAHQPPRAVPLQGPAEMSTIESLHRARLHPTVRVEADINGAGDWLYMHADHAAGIRPCFRVELMHDMWSMLSEVSASSSINS